MTNPTAADSIAQLATAMDTSQPLAFIRHQGSDDVYQRGEVLFVLPGIWTSMPTSLLATVRARRACAVTGRCPECGGVAALATREFPHEPDCQVPDDHLYPALRRWTRHVGTFARGRRIQEIPS